jgi:hypothetical protein
MTDLAGIARVAFLDAGNRVAAANHNITTKKQAKETWKTCSIELHWGKFN